MNEGQIQPLHQMSSELDTRSDGQTAVRDPFDVFRAQHYTLLAVLLSRAPDEQTLALVAALEGGEGPLGAAHQALSQIAAQTTHAAVEREYFRLFIGVGRGELVPYASYYQTGFLQEKPLARLRQTLRELGIERAPSLVELEDHAAVLCEIMAGLIDNRFDAPSGADAAFFRDHVEPWIGRFFADLQAADGAPFYGRVGAVARAFLAIETQALALAA